jgi:uncharacterized low-complexity protein
MNALKMKTILLIALVGTWALASAPTGQTVLPVAQATCECKTKGEHTCAKDKCKASEAHQRVPKMAEPLTGSHDSTRLPDTARLDARGGIFI